MAALVVLVIFERRRPCGARCTGHLRASRLTVPPSPGEGEFVRSGRAIFGAVGLNKPASNCKLLFWNGLGLLPNWQSTWTMWPKWIKYREHCVCFSGDDLHEGGQDCLMIWRAALAAGFPFQENCCDTICPIGSFPPNFGPRGTLAI